MELNSRQLGEIINVNSVGIRFVHIFISDDFLMSLFLKIGKATNIAICAL